MINNYIFTITTGRSGQSSLHSILKLYSKNCYSAFEAPDIKLFFPRALGDIEKIIRRKFFETNELLGRGKVLKAYENKDYQYIEKIASMRLKNIRKKARKFKANTYFDVSKFYVRGLYLGFNKLLENITLVFLVRDPLLNMKSFFNRNKNFYLDNNKPEKYINLLRMNSNNMNIQELYFWAWAETYLRYKKIAKFKKVKNFIRIKNDLAKLTYRSKVR